MTSGLVCGLLLVGRDPVVNLSGSLVAAPDGSRLVALSLLPQLPPLLAMAAFALMLSVITRSSLVGGAGPVVGGLASQLVALVDQPALLRQISPAGAFTAWRGLWLDNPDIYPSAVGTASSLLTTTACVAVAAIVFARRDVVIR